MRRAVFALVCLAVVGCTTNPEVNWVTRLAVACDSYAASLQILAGKRALGNLSPATVRAVNAAVVIVGPVCKPGAVITNHQQALVQISAAVHRLVLLKAQET